jgi:hypothetical protein
LAHQRIVRSLFDDTDELMPDGSFEAGIASSNLKIRIADSREEHADYGLSALLRFIDIFQREAALTDL